MPVLQTYKFNPPIVDESLKQWLHKTSVEELREHLKVQNRKEWTALWIEARPFVILYIIALAIVCLLLWLANSNGFLGDLLVYALVGFFFSAAFAAFRVGSLFYDVHWRRWRWFKKQKLQLMKSLPPKDEQEVDYSNN